MVSLPLQTPAERWDVCGPKRRGTGWWNLVTHLICSNSNSEASAAFALTAEPKSASDLGGHVTQRRGDNIDKIQITFSVYFSETCYLVFFLTSSHNQILSKDGTIQYGLRTEDEIRLH